MWPEGNDVGRASDAVELKGDLLRLGLPYGAVVTPYITRLAWQEGPSLGHYTKVHDTTGTWMEKQERTLAQEVGRNMRAALVHAEGPFSLVFQVSAYKLEAHLAGRLPDWGLANLTCWG
jgi:hypothetical protein